MTDEILLYQGGAIKALGGGKVGGYLIMFGSPDQHDLVKDFFTKDTEFFVEDGGTLPVLYDHGLDATLKRRKIGRGTIKIDDVGVWLEAQMALRDDYEKAVYKMAEENKLGWSSGAASHLTERKQVKNAHQILAWGLAEASLTPVPCESRSQAITLKAYIEESEDPILTPGKIEGELAEGLKTIISEDPGLRFSERLDLVLAAVEVVVQDAVEIQELRIKRGAKISKSRMDKLKQIMGQLEALMMEVEPADMAKMDKGKDMGKSVDADALRSLLVQHEQRKWMHTKASII